MKKSVSFLTCLLTFPLVFASCGGEKGGGRGKGGGGVAASAKSTTSAPWYLL